jgi:glycosyltransferase involved in cell wall biosynthesis
MKIVFFIDHLRHDGTQHVLKQLVEGLAARGHEQAIVCFNDSWDDVLVGDLKRARAHVRVVGKWATASGWGLLTTWRWLMRNQFDVAVTLLYVADLLGRPLAHYARIPRIVSSLRARNIHYSAWKLALTRWSMRWANTVVLNSIAVRDFALFHEGARANQLVYIPNGISVKDFGPSGRRSDLCAEFGIPAEHLVLGSVGRLTYQKGLDILLQALARIHTKDIDWLIIGTGEQESELRALARELDIESRVHFAGYRRDVARWLGALDLYVHPARFEGMPNAVLEAMAAGCAIVATTVDGTRELIQDGVHGWLVPPDNVEALGQAISAALADPLQARQRGQMAQQHAELGFSVDAMVTAWEHVLRGEMIDFCAAGWTRE